jgi:hypothetical protein
MIELAEMAVHMAKTEHGVALDYGVDSVEKVERILGSIDEEKGEGQVPLERRRELAVRYGAYVGEVIRRKWDGRWARHHEVMGPDSFPISWRGHDSFPIGWCFKRLTNGPEDNVWRKLQVLSRQEADDAAVPAADARPRH